MRKRRISADSVDSGSASGREMHPQTAHDLSKLVTHPNSVVTPTTPTKTVTPVPTSDGEMSSPLKRKKCKLDKSAKKHKKKHKHHHCSKHRHKKRRHDDNDDDDDDEEDQHRDDDDDDKHDQDRGDDDDDLRIKLDGSFNNTTTYSIRSPMYHARSEESNHDDGDDESSDDDGFSDDDRVTSVKAVSFYTR